MYASLIPGASSNVCSCGLKQRVHHVRVKQDDSGMCAHSLSCEASCAVLSPLLVLDSIHVLCYTSIEFNFPACVYVRVLRCSLI